LVAGVGAVGAGVVGAGVVGAGAGVALPGAGAVGAGVVAEVIPAWFGNVDVTFWENSFGRLWTLVYFGFFVFMWVYTRGGREKTRPVPERVVYDHD